MGHTRIPAKGKLIIGLLLGKPELFQKVKAALERTFGRADFESRTLDFSHTDYYNAEMGGSLKRRFLSFERLSDIAALYRAKARTNALEERFSAKGRRMVNIDPGYLDLAKLVLFSTKDYSHRIYLRDGIFAEATLFYKDNTFTPWPWTYTDYKSMEYIAIFNSIRNIYKKQRRLW